MKHLVRDFRLSLGRMNSQHIQVLFLVLMLSLFILGAGAPAATGGPGGM